MRTTQFLQGKTTRWGVAWSFAKEAANTGATPLQPGGVSSGSGSVAPSVKPCHRMTFELQAGSRNSGKKVPSQVLREMRLALESAGCVVEPPDARDPLKLRCRAVDGDGGAATLSFSAIVMQHAPGSLLISATCDDGPKTELRAQRMFARTVISARTRMNA